jgi:hypothetical protein
MLRDGELDPANWHSQRKLQPVIRHIPLYVYTVMFCIRFWQNKLVKGVNIPFLGGITRIADAAAGFVCAEYGPLSIPHLLS